MYNRAGSIPAISLRVKDTGAETVSDEKPPKKKRVDQMVELMDGDTFNSVSKPVVRKGKGADGVAWQRNVPPDRSDMLIDSVAKARGMIERGELTLRIDNTNIHYIDNVALMTVLLVMQRNSTFGRRKGVVSTSTISHWFGQQWRLHNGTDRYRAASLIWRWLQQLSSGRK